MNKLLLCIFIITNLCADITNTKQTFTVLCIEDDSTGFSWKNMQWQQTKYTSSKYIIKKIKDSKYCSSEHLNKSSTDDYQYISGCYIGKRFGHNDLSIGHKQAEVWKLINKKYILVRVNYSDVWLRLHFAPNGEFIQSLTRVNLLDGASKNYRDSISVSHGKCSIIDNDL